MRFLPLDVEIWEKNDNPLSLQVYPVLVPKDGSHHFPISRAMTWVQAHSNVTGLRASGTRSHPSFTSLNLSAQVQLSPPLLIHWIISFLVLVIHFLQLWPQICEIWRSLLPKVLPILSSHSFLTKTSVYATKKCFSSWLIHKLLSVVPIIILTQFYYLIQISFSPFLLSCILGAKNYIGFVHSCISWE